MHKITAKHVEQGILIAPLLVALVWMAGLITTPTSTEAMSPSTMEGLITALFIFIVAYALVLAGLFYSMSKSAKSA